jgi:hypothetical protein
VRFIVLCAILCGCSEYKLSSIAPRQTGSGDMAGDGGDLDVDVVLWNGENPRVPSARQPTDGTPTGDGDGGDGDTGEHLDGDTGGSSGGDGGTDLGDTGTSSTGDSGTGEIPDDVCELAAATSGYLDAFETPGDGRVLYCHSGSGKSYVFVDSDIDSCLAHLDHRGDVFPTTLCDS